MEEIKLSTPMKIFTVFTTALVLYCGLDYFIRGGLPYVTSMNQWNTLTLPVILPIAVVTLLQGQIKKIRGPHNLLWFQTISFFVAFILTLVAGLAAGIYNPYYLDIYDMIPNTGYAAMLAVVGYNFASAYIRAYVARSMISGVILLFTILSVMGASPLGEMFLYPTKIFGDWWAMYAQGGLQSGWGLASYAATVILLLRISIGQERLRARM